MFFQLASTHHSFHNLPVGFQIRKRKTSWTGNSWPTYMKVMVLVAAVERWPMFSSASRMRICILFAIAKAIRKQKIADLNKAQNKSIKLLFLFQKKKQKTNSHACSLPSFSCTPSIVISVAYLFFPVLGRRKHHSTRGEVYITQTRRGHVLYSGSWTHFGTGNTELWGATLKNNTFLGGCVLSGCRTESCGMQCWVDWSG